MMTSSRKGLVTAMTVVAATCITPLAFAATQSTSNDDNVTATVRYQHSELWTARGAKRVAQRLRISAAEVCGGDDPVFRNSMGFADCERSAIKRALANVNAPMVEQALGFRQEELAQH